MSSPKDSINNNNNNTSSNRIPQRRKNNEFKRKHSDTANNNNNNNDNNNEDLHSASINSGTLSQSNLSTSSAVMREFIDRETARLSTTVIPEKQASERRFLDQKEDVYRGILWKQKQTEIQQLYNEYLRECRRLGLRTPSSRAGPNSSPLSASLGVNEANYLLHDEAANSNGGSKIPSRRVSGAATPADSPKSNRDFSLFQQLKHMNTRSEEVEAAEGREQTPPDASAEDSPLLPPPAAEDNNNNNNSNDSNDAVSRAIEVDDALNEKQVTEDSDEKRGVVEVEAAKAAKDTGDKQADSADEEKTEPRWKDKLALEASQAEVKLLRFENEQLRRDNDELKLLQQLNNAGGAAIECSEPRSRSGTMAPDRANNNNGEGEANYGSTSTRTPSRAREVSPLKDASNNNNNNSPDALGSAAPAANADDDTKKYDDDSFAAEFQLVARAFFWPLHVAPSQQENIEKLRLKQLRDRLIHERGVKSITGLASAIPDAIGLLPGVVSGGAKSSGTADTDVKPDGEGDLLQQYVLREQDVERASPYYYCYELDGEVQALRGAATTKLIRNTNNFKNMLLRRGKRQKQQQQQQQEEEDEDDDTTNIYENDGTKFISRPRNAKNKNPMGDEFDADEDDEDYFSENEEVHNSNDSRGRGRRVDKLREKYPLLLPHLQRMWVTSVIRQLILNIFNLFFLTLLFLQGTIGGSLNIFDVSTSSYTIAANRYSSNALLVSIEYGSMALGIAVLTGLVRNRSRLSGALSREELINKQELESEAEHGYTTSEGFAQRGGTKRVRDAEKGWWHAPAKLLGGCALCFLGSVVLFYSGRYDNYLLAMCGRCLYGFGAAASLLSVCSITFAEVGVVAGVGICLPLIVAAHLGSNAAANFVWPMLSMVGLTTMDALRLTLYLAAGSFIFALGMLTLVPPRMLRHSARTNVDFFEWASIRRAWRYVSIPFILRLLTLACVWGAVVVLKITTEPLLLAVPASDAATPSTVAPTTAPVGTAALVTPNTNSAGSPGGGVHDLELISSEKEMRHVVGMMFLCAVVLFPLLLSPYPASLFHSKATTPLAVALLALCWFLYYIYSPYLAANTHTHLLGWLQSVTPIACAAITGTVLAIVATSVIRGIANAGVTLPSPARAPGTSSKRRVNELFRSRGAMIAESSPLLTATLSNTSVIGASTAAEVEEARNKQRLEARMRAQGSPYLFLTKGGPSAMVVLGVMFGLAVSLGSAAASASVTTILLEFAEVKKDSGGSGGKSSFQAWSATLQRPEKAHETLSYVMLAFCSLAFLSQLSEYAYLYWN